jgi:hypothetical protein
MAVAIVQVTTTSTTIEAKGAVSGITGVGVELGEGLGDEEGDGLGDGEGVGVGVGDGEGEG